MSAKARDGQDRKPFLRTSNVLWDEIDLSVVDEMAITDEELRSKSLAPGDLLVCEGGDIGRAAIWTGQREIMSYQNHLHRLRPKTKLTDSRFYVYFLQCGFTQLGIFEGAGNKTTIPNLSKNRLAVLEVPVPAIQEQQDIALMLSTVRSSIKAHAHARQLAQELKAATMTEVFTRGLRGEAQKQTEIGWVPESWSLRRLDEIAKVISTRMAYSDLESMPNEEILGDAVNVLGIKVSDMNRLGNEVIVRHSATSRVIGASVAARRCAPPGTIIFPKRGAAIATNKKRMTAGWTVFDPNVIGVTAQGVDRNFLFQWFQRFDLKTITEAGPTPQLNKKNLDPLLIAAPSSQDEQHEIVAILDAIDRKISLHQQKRAVLEALFKALLHKLMTGEIDVNDLDLTALTALTALSTENEGSRA